MVVARMEGDPRIESGAHPGRPDSGRWLHRVRKDDPSVDHALFRSVSFHYGLSDRRGHLLTWLRGGCRCVPRWRPT